MTKEELKAKIDLCVAQQGNQSGLAGLAEILNALTEQGSEGGAVVINMTAETEEEIAKNAAAFQLIKNNAASSTIAKLSMGEANMLIPLTALYDNDNDVVKLLMAPVLGTLFIQGTSVTLNSDGTLDESSFEEFGIVSIRIALGDNENNKSAFEKISQITGGGNRGEEDVMPYVSIFDAGKCMKPIAMNSTTSPETYVFKCASLSEGGVIDTYTLSSDGSLVKSSAQNNVLLFLRKPDETITTLEELEACGITKQVIMDAASGKYTHARHGNIAAGLSELYCITALYSSMINSYVLEYFRLTPSAGSTLIAGFQILISGNNVTVSKLSGNE